MTTLITTDLKSLKLLDISGTNIIGLDTSSFIKLEKLYADKSKLAYLDTKNFRSLKILSIRNSNIHYISATALTNLEEL